MFKLDEKVKAILSFFFKQLAQTHTMVSMNVLGLENLLEIMTEN